MSGTNLTTARSFLRTGRSEETTNSTCLMHAGSQQEYLRVNTAAHQEIQNHVEEALNRYTKSPEIPQERRIKNQNDLLIFRLGHKELNQKLESQAGEQGVAGVLSRIFSAFNDGVAKSIGGALSKAAP